MSNSTYPWLNPNERYTFYMVALTSWSDTLQLGTEVLLTAIQFAYTTSKWTFDRFLQIYKPYIDITEHEIRELKNVTYSEFCEFVRRNYSKVAGNHTDDNAYGENYIDVIKFETIDQFFPVTGEVYRKVEEDEYTSSVESLAIPLLVEAKLFFDRLTESGYVKETDEIKLIRHMLNKAVDVYITLYLLCTYHEYSDHAERGEWFLHLPDKFKVEMTRGAGFPRPIEELDWSEILTEDFNLLQWLEHIVGFPDPIDTGEKHSTLAHVDVGSVRRNEYQNMVSNYTNGWGFLTC